MNSARTKKQIRLRPDERRRQLMDCAIQAFARRGLNRAGHADIAGLAGVSVPTVFNYFRTREDLVDAVLTEVETFFLNLAQRIYRNQPDGLAAVLEHAHSFVTAAEQNENHVKIWLEWGASIRQDIWPRYLAYNSQLIALVSGAISHAQQAGKLPSFIPAFEIASFLISSAHFVVTRLYTPGQNAQQVKEYIDTLAKQLLVDWLSVPGYK